MKIMIVSPHPDDETLGAGGFILKHNEIGDEIFWLNITNIEINEIWSEEAVNHRMSQIAKINEYYKFAGYFDLHYAPTFLENTVRKDLIDQFSSIIHEVEPEWIILPSHLDAHSDHKVINEIGMVCSKIFRYPYIKKVMTMEILSETNFSNLENVFSPNYYCDISDYMDKKLRALQIYDTELGEHPFPRSLEAIKSLAILRGQMAGCRYAEAFRIIREVE